MTRNLSLKAGLTCLGLAIASTVALAEPTQKELVAVYVGLQFVQEAHEHCLNQGASLTEKQHKNWQQTNHVETLTAFLAHERKENASLDKNLNDSQKTVASLAQAYNLAQCKNLPIMLNDPMLQLAKSYPDVITYAKTQVSASAASVKSNKTSANQTASLQTAVKPASPKQDDSFSEKHAEQLQKNIKHVVFHDWVLGGNHAAVPFLLFNDGTATSDMAVLTEFTSVKAHQKEFPKRWMQWRKRFGSFQLKTNNGWTDFRYQTPAVEFKDGFQIDTKFQRLSGGHGAGSVRSFRFYKDGRFTRGGMVWANYEANLAGSASHSAYSEFSDQQGRYHIDGFVLTLNYDSGKTDHYAIATDDKGQPDVIWLNGFAYVER